jgi:uncharacterized protein YbjT (DUF2867 family)
MRIAVAGGTGTLGRHVLAALAERGHETRALSRNEPGRPLPESATHATVDLTTGAGLVEALENIDAVVDASNGPPSRKAEAVLVTGTQKLLEAEQRAGVRHHVCASIVGIDATPSAYYEVKLRQEERVERGPIGWTIVRATQFHDLVAATFASLARTRVLPAPRFPLQPLDVAVAAALIADTAEKDPHRTRIEIAGPQIQSVRDLATTWRDLTHARAAILPFPLPGKLGRALRAGRLTSSENAAAGTPTFADWLSGSGAKG